MNVKKKKAFNYELIRFFQWQISILPLPTSNYFFKNIHVNVFEKSLLLDGIQWIVNTAVNFLDENYLKQHKL